MKCMVVFIIEKSYSKLFSGIVHGHDDFFFADFLFRSSAVCADSHYCSIVVAVDCVPDVIAELFSIIFYFLSL